jgi:hypothetical protein
MPMTKAMHVNDIIKTYCDMFSKWRSTTLTKL